MTLLNRDIAVPPDEVPDAVETFQTKQYLDVVLAALIVYDTRAPSILFLSLRFC